MVLKRGKLSCFSHMKYITLQTLFMLMDFTKRIDTIQNVWDSPFCGLRGHRSKLKLLMIYVPTDFLS